MNTMEKDIERIVAEEMAALNRPDLYRSPMVAFSSAKDPRYLELKERIGPWHNTPGELLPGAESVISYFVPFTRPVTAAPKTAEGCAPLWGEAYEIINRYFGHINEAVAAHLTGLGYAASPIPATHTYDPRDMKCMWSHRSAAAIAGLGAFGANRLLITRKGSGGRFCTVLTSAPLRGELEPAPNRCLHIKNGSCELCFKACPVQALEPGSIDRFTCQAELFKNGERLKEYTALTSADACGKCIGACPFAYIE